jgi:hypothetical protein
VRCVATIHLAYGRTIVQKSVSRCPLGNSDALVGRDYIEQIDMPSRDTPITNREKLVGKRPWTDSVSAEGYSEQRLLPAIPRALAYKKRQRMVVNSRHRQISQRLSKSMTFTKKLERLLNGEVNDMMLGNGNLSLSATL